MLSMTGFGVGEASLGGARLLVELRAVNHRHLDVRVRMPPELLDHTSLVEEIARGTLDRGRVEINVRLERGDDAPGDVALDRARAKRALEELRALRDEVAPGEAVPLSLLAAVPDLFTSARPMHADESQIAVRTAVMSAIEAATKMRAREGEALARDLLGRVDSIDTLARTVRTRAPLIVDAYRTKLKERVGRLLEGTQLAVDPARLEQEVVFHAERCDIEEELTRLVSHTEQFRELCRGARPAGRELDFLLQEMGREVNTLGSKSPDSDVSRAVIEMKAELGRLREQAQNVL